MRAEGNIGGQRASVWFNRVHGTEWKQGEGGLGRWAAARTRSPGRGPWPLGPVTATPSLVFFTGPLPSGHPKEQRRLWVGVYGGLFAWENPRIGAPASVLSPTLGHNS